jgi:hypothetical protein
MVASEEEEEMVTRRSMELCYESNKTRGVGFEVRAEIVDELLYCVYRSLQG